MRAPVEVRELLPPDSGLAYRAMRELRPHLVSEEDFVTRVDGTQRAEGYRLAGAFAPERDAREALAVAGFRIVHMLAWGTALYLDDLSTLPAARRRGCAAALLGWLVTEAQRLGCGQLHLDSGMGPEREDAHRLYFNHGLRIVSYHFARGLPAAAGETPRGLSAAAGETPGR